MPKPYKYSVNAKPSMQGTDTELTVPYPPTPPPLPLFSSKVTVLSLLQDIQHTKCGKNVFKEILFKFKVIIIIY